MISLLAVILLSTCWCEPGSFYLCRCHAHPGSRFYGPVLSGVYSPSTWDTISSPQPWGRFYPFIWMTFSSSTSLWYGLSILLVINLKEDLSHSDSVIYYQGVYPRTWYMWSQMIQYKLSYRMVLLPQCHPWPASWHPLVADTSLIFLFPVELSPPPSSGKSSWLPVSSIRFFHFCEFFTGAYIGLQVREGVIFWNYCLVLTYKTKYFFNSLLFKMHVYFPVSVNEMWKYVTLFSSIVFFLFTIETSFDDSLN